MTSYHEVPHFIGNTPLIRLRRLSELGKKELKDIIGMLQEQTIGSRPGE